MCCVNLTVAVNERSVIPHEHSLRTVLEDEGMEYRRLNCGRHPDTGIASLLLGNRVH